MAKKYTLAQALEAVLERGAEARRESWPQPYLVSMTEGALTILKEDGENHPWNITVADITKDWEVYE